MVFIGFGFTENGKWHETWQRHVDNLSGNVESLDRIFGLLVLRPVDVCFCVFPL